MVVGTQKCFRLLCTDFWWMNHGATKRPNRFANWMDLFQAQTVVKVLREKQHISGMASEWMPEYMCLSFPWCPKLCGVSFCQIPVQNDSEIACVSERNLLNTCMQFVCRLNTVSKTTCVLWQFDKTTCRLLTALKEKNIETAYELHIKDVLIFDHFLVNISPIFGSSFNQTERERHYIKDASLAQKSQHARRFLPNKGSAANKKLNMFGWNTLEMICTVDGLTHPPHRLPIYLKFIGKIHIVDFCTYTCVILSVVSYPMGIEFAKHSKFPKGFRTKSTIGLKLQRPWQWT